MEKNWNNNIDNTKIEAVDIKAGKAVQAEVAPQDITDISEGEAVVLRVFKYGLNPEYRGKIDKQELFNSHIHAIEAMIWRDGLVPHLDIPPKVTLSKKGYTIFLACRPKLVGSSRMMINEKPKTLQQVLANQ